MTVSGRWQGRPSCQIVHLFVRTGWRPPSWSGLAPWSSMAWEPHDNMRGLRVVGDGVQCGRHPALAGRDCPPPPTTRPAGLSMAAWHQFGICFPCPAQGRMSKVRRIHVLCRLYQSLDRWVHQAKGGGGGLLGLGLLEGSKPHYVDKARQTFVCHFMFLEL